MTRQSALDEWRTRAACVGDPRMGTDDPRVARQAVQLCEACPVRGSCAAWARSEKVFEGIAGGFWWVNGHPVKIPAPRLPVYLPAELRAGHTAWARGERDPATGRLERAYQRHRKAANRRRAA